MLDLILATYLSFNLPYANPEPEFDIGRDSVQALRIPYRISQLLMVIIKKILLVLSSRVNLKLRSQHQTRVKSKKKLMKKLVQVRMSHGKE
jgi:hypothetical protein